jgi:hypothetical protein
MDDTRDKQIADAVINARQHDREDLAIDHAAYVVGQYRLEIESRIRAEALREAKDRVNDLFAMFHKSLRSTSNTRAEFDLYKAYDDMDDRVLQEHIDTAVEWSGIFKSAAILADTEPKP